MQTEAELGQYNVIYITICVGNNFAQSCRHTSQLYVHKKETVTVVVCRRILVTVINYKKVHRQCLGVLLFVLQTSCETVVQD